MRADFSGCSAPTMYWIGGTGSWDDGAHWSFSSGGAANPDSCTPDIINSAVVFDNSSGTGNATVNYSATLGNLTLTPTTNMKVVIGANGSLTLMSLGIPPESPVDLSSISNAFYVVLFLTFCALLVIGIWKVHRWRS